MSADRQQYCRLAIQGQTKSLYKMNAIAKPGIRLCPNGSLCDPQKALLGTFAASGKSTIVPLLTESRKEPVSLFKGKGRTHLFQEEKKRRSFCDVTKGTKNTEKGRGIPLPFSNPSPLTNVGIATFSVCVKFPAAARYTGNKTISSV